MLRTVHVWIARDFPARVHFKSQATAECGCTPLQAETTALPLPFLDMQGSPGVDALHISGGSPVLADPQADEAQSEPNPLSMYPRCKHLIDVYRALPGAQNKTPLAVLHEYSTRLNLEVSTRCYAYITMMVMRVCKAHDCLALILAWHFWGDLCLFPVRKHRHA